jgi:hypothetical protein
VSLVIFPFDGIEENLIVKISFFGIENFPVIIDDPFFGEKVFGWVGSRFEEVQIHGSKLGIKNIMVKQPLRFWNEPCFLR